MKSDRLTARFKYALAAVAALSVLAAGYAGVRSRQALVGKVGAVNAAPAGQGPKVVPLETYVPPGVPVALTNAVALLDKTDNPNQHRRQSLRGNLQVDPSTPGMSFSLPLANYPGRGRSLPVTLNYSSKLWRMQLAEGFYGHADLQLVHESLDRHPGPRHRDAVTEQRSGG